MDKILTHKYLSLTLFLVIGFSAGFLFGYKLKATTLLPASPIRENTTDYSFIHPLLATGITNTVNPTPSYANLAKKVKDFIANQRNSSYINNASVYFINYEKNAGFFSFNEDKKYAPASLLKVVIMVGYLKKSDDDPAILNRQLVYTSDVARNIEMIPFDLPSKLKIGTAYTVSTLIDKMIIDSDNGAMGLLLDNISSSFLNEVYINLGLDVPKDDTLYTISAKGYSLFFRVLYNATYLSKNSSEKALSILSQVTFKDGLTKQLPVNVAVAHKFGEHLNLKNNQIETIELHDCGIIYHQTGPYLLCVMTEGKSYDQLADFISNLSKMVYDDMSSR